MDKIMVIGANTRPIACSLNKLGYSVYSVDYFGCNDLKTCVTDYKSFLLQKPLHSCGFFSKNFFSESLIEMASEFIDSTDFIVCSSGVSPSELPKNKLIGNNDIKDIENKYKLYKQLKNKFEDIFKLPETFLIRDIQEAVEIGNSHKEKQFLLKPLIGSGGVGIINFDDPDLNDKFHEVLMQEVVPGHDVSASVLSSGYDARTILTSQQLIGDKNLGQNERYGYCGNIVPYTENTLNSLSNSIETVSEEIIKELKLVGSNGVDMIIKDGEIYVIEVNPRLQGTFEVAEASLGINMIEAHIKACEGDLMDIPAPKKFAVKMIVFADKRSKVGDLNMEGVHDIPHPNVIIEKGEPVCTVLTSGRVLEDSLFRSKRIVNYVYRNLNPIT